MFLQDRNCPISQIIEEINKYKSLDIKGKALVGKRLLSKNIIIIANTAQIKKQLK